MLNILQINAVNFGSTGKIMLQISKKGDEKGHSSIIVSPKSRENMQHIQKNQVFIGSRFSRNLHRLIAKYVGLQDCCSLFSTAVFLHKLNKFKPDLVQLHNLHGCYINIPLLFHYLKRKAIPVVWTLHDCWAFTGQCPYFSIANCDKWKTGCYDCCQYKQYPASNVDLTKRMWKLKRKWFTGVRNMTIVTPSQWLADLVKESYLKDYPVKIIHNGIDLSVFKPTKSKFREKYGIVADKQILLGVAFGWGKRKGLDVFIELANRLDKNKYQIVLVGTDDDVDKLLPENIISVHRTQNQQELAEIYTTADLFVNPTREEVLGLVNVESLACGTPVITFNSGGSPECIDGTCGSIVDCDDFGTLEREIVRICSDKPYSEESCIERAKAFDMNARFDDYIRLYEKKNGYK